MIRRLGGPGMHGVGGMALAAMGANCPGGAVGNGLLNALIAYWPGNEVNGNALDLHTNALHLTDGNTVTSNPGLVYALARQYTRANSEFHYRLADDALLSAGDTDLTMAAWVYLDSKPGQMGITAKHNAATIAGSEYLLSYSSAVDRFQLEVYLAPATAPTVVANTFGAPALTTWYLVVAWHDSVANTINIQINDGGIDSVAHAGGLNDTVAVFSIGGIAAAPGAVAWDGRIGPTMFWKSAGGGGGVLTAAQKTALYNAGAGLTYAAFTA